MKSETALVGGEIVFPPAFPARTIELISKALSFGNPAYFTAIGMDRPTRGIPERVTVERGVNEGTAFPRGAAEIIKMICAEEGIRLKYDDQRTWGELIEPGIPTFKLRGYQLDAVRAARKKTQGLIVVPCGGGKTTIGAGIIHEIGWRTIIMVHTEDLHDQWVEVLEEKLGIKSGSVIGSKWKPGEVTVASVPKLVSALKSSMHYQKAVDLLRAQGVCILDEAHHAPANTFQLVLRECPARFRFGLTATDKRDDGLTRLLDWSFGKHIYEIKVDDLVDQGFLIRPKLEVVETRFVFQSKLKDVRKRAHDMEAKLAEDDDRAAVVADLAVRESWRDEVKLILANRVDYALKLSRLIWERGEEASVVSSKSLKSVRKNTIKLFRQGKIKILIATSLADEGLDCPSLAKIILAWPESPRSRTIQRIGRLMRPYDKQPVFVDVLDPLVPDLVRRHEDRQRIYRSLKMIPKRKRGTKNENNEAQVRLDR